MPWATVFANVYLPLKLTGMGRDEASPRILKTLSRVGLREFADAYPRQLSGGMRMRVSIARALVTAPRVLLMDEPFAALDEITRFKLNDDLIALWRELRMTVVFVTHSVFESVYLSQRVVVMSARPGRVFAELADRRGRARRGLSHLRRVCRPLPRRVGCARPRDAGEPRSRGMSDRVLRFVLPAVALALGVLAWDLVVRVNALPPYILPGPGLVVSTLVADWADPLEFADRHAGNDARGAGARA